MTPARKPAKPAETATAKGGMAAFPGGHLGQFAKKLGSTKGTDPIPPDQYLTFQDKRYTPTQRLWAWMLAHTIRHGHRSAIAVDSLGVPVNLNHAAAHLDMDHGNVRRAWRQLESDNRVRKEENGDLRLLGDLTLPISCKLPANPEDEWEKVCTDLYPPYIRKQLGKYPPTVRAATIEASRKETDLELQYMAAAVAAIRGIFAPRKDNILTTVGVNVQRTKKRKKDSKESKNQLFLDAVARSVQTSLEKGLYNVEKSSVQSENDEPHLIRLTEGISREEPASERSCSGVPQNTPKPPARPNGSTQEKRHWHAGLFTFLITLPIGTALDTPMLHRIAGHLTEELLPQFKTAAKHAKGIRSWAGYEDIARQVAERGLVPATTANPMPERKQTYRESVISEVQRRSNYGKD